MQILIYRAVGASPKSSLPLWGRWISRKMLALFRERRMRSLTLILRRFQHKREAHHKGTSSDPLRGPPSPSGEGFWMPQQLDKSEVVRN